MRLYLALHLNTFYKKRIKVSLGYKHLVKMIPELSASKVAAFIGLNRYQPPSEVMYSLLKKDPTLKQKIAGIEEAHSRRPFNTVLSDIVREPVIRGCIAEGLRQCKGADDLAPILESVRNKTRLVLGNRYEEESRERLITEVAGRVNKRRGLQNENTILDSYETTNDVKVTERNTKLLKMSFPTFRLIGRIDGFVASENKIVDSKDRTRMWDAVPVYDEIQMRVYMKLTGAVQAELIERFPNGTVRLTKFDNEVEKWNTIEKEIESGVQRMRAICENEEELKELVFANTVSIA